MFPPEINTNLNSISSPIVFGNQTETWIFQQKNCQRYRNLIEEKHCFAVCDAWERRRRRRRLNPQIIQLKISIPSKKFLLITKTHEPFHSNSSHLCGFQCIPKSKLGSKKLWTCLNFQEAPSFDILQSSVQELSGVSCTH